MPTLSVRNVGFSPSEPTVMRDTFWQVGRSIRLPRLGLCALPIGRLPENYFSRFANRFANARALSC